MTKRRGALPSLVAAAGWAHAVVLAAVMISVASVGEWTYPSKLLLYAPRHPWLLTTLLLAPAIAWAQRSTLLVIHCVLALVVAFPWMGTRIERTRAPGGSAIRLLTWNVFWGKLGALEIAEQIAASSPDVVALQASKSLILERIGAALPSHQLHDDGEFALASKLPLLSAEVPPPFAEEEPRQFVAYLLRTANGRPLRVFVVHPFSPRHALFDRRDARADSERRDRQLAAVAEAAEAAERAAEPFVIVGDTNLPGWSKILRARLGRHRDAFDDVGMGLGYTFPANRPWMRIDRVIGGPGVRFLSIQVRDLGASDHRAVLVELEVP